MKKQSNPPPTFKKPPPPPKPPGKITPREFDNPYGHRASIGTIRRSR